MQSIEIVLGNKTALDAFKQYLQSCNQEKYLFFWLHVENFQVSAEKLTKGRYSTFDSLMWCVESESFNTLNKIIHSDHKSTSYPSFCLENLVQLNHIKCPHFEQLHVRYTKNIYHNQAGFITMKFISVSFQRQDSSNWSV